MDVSIVIPVYQGRRFLARAVDSCFREFGEACRGEVVAVDDGSTDGSLDLLRGFGRALRIIPCAQRQGRNAARNRGLLEARGQFVKFLDQDDFLEPGSLQEELLLAKCTRADMVVSACRIAPLEDGGERIVMPLDPARGIDALLAGQGALTAAVLYRRSYLDGCHWTEDAGKLDDWRFLLTAALKLGHIEARPGVAYTWFQHPGQHSRQHSPIENARIFYRTLDWLEERLREMNQLGPERQKRVAQYRYKELGVLGRYDRVAFEVEAKKILSLDPAFRPIDEEPRAWMRALARLLGFRAALRLYLVVRDCVPGMKHWRKEVG